VAIAEQVLYNLNELAEKQAALINLIDGFQVSEERKEEAQDELEGTQEWWDECIDVLGYDQETTEWMDPGNTNEIAFFEDGSYIVHDSDGWATFQCEDLEDIRRGDHIATWIQDKLAPHWDLRSESPDSPPVEY